MTTTAPARWHILPAAAYENFGALPRAMQALAHSQETASAESYLKGRGESLEPSEVKHLAFARHLAMTRRLEGEFFIRRAA